MIGEGKLSRLFRRMGCVSAHRPRVFAGFQLSLEDGDGKVGNRLCGLSLACLPTLYLIVKLNQQRRGRNTPAPFQGFPRPFNRAPPSGSAAEARMETPDPNLLRHSFLSKAYIVSSLVRVLSELG